MLTHLVQTDRGGAACSAALHAPETVRSLVLVGPTTDPRARSGIGQVRRWLRNARHEPRGLAPLTFRDYPEAGFRRVVRSFAESVRDRIEDKLPAVGVPVLVVRGEHDALVPHAAPRDFGDLVEEFLTG